MLRKLKAGLAALALSFAALLPAEADNLVIDGLGSFPLGNDIKVEDGGQTYLESAMKKERARKDYSKTGSALLSDLLTVPPGVELYPKKAPFPVESMHVYQLFTGRVTGMYSAMVFVYSGNDQDLFQGASRRDKEFWTKKAFISGPDRPTGLFGLLRIRPEEYQSVVDHVEKEVQGGRNHIQVLDVMPWHALKEQNGSWHWEQETKVIVTDEKDLSYPLWTDASFYKNGNRYYLVVVSGSHSSRDILGPVLTGAKYTLTRS